jgi:predicted glycosyltransferase
MPRLPPKRTTVYDKVVVIFIFAQLVEFSTQFRIRGSLSETRKYFGNVDKPEDLKNAVNVAGLDGNVILVAVGGSSKHLVTALNLIHNLRHRGRSDNVLLLTGSQQNCQFIATQHIVPVRVCTWTDKLSQPRCVLSPR